VCATAPTAPGPISNLIVQIAARSALSRGAVCNRSNAIVLAIAPTHASTKGNTMNWDVIEGNWKQFKGHVKEKWGKLTDDNLDAIAGKREQLVGRIQETYGITKDQTEVQLKAFEETHKDYQPTHSA
jgi:uncharacterized protein YjbJ (UPF0337 family)